jgi:hypothetical protein
VPCAQKEICFLVQKPGNLVDTLAVHKVPTKNVSVSFFVDKPLNQIVKDFVVIKTEAQSVLALHLRMRLTARPFALPFFRVLVLTLNLWPIIIHSVSVAQNV